MTVSVFDERPLLEREKTPPPEVDLDLAEFLRDTLLFEQYDGLAADDLSTGDSSDTASDISAGVVLAERDDDEESTAGGQRDNYGVPAAELARRHFRVVDSWFSQAMRIAARSAGDFERRVLERDGELLVEALGRQSLRDEKKGPTRGIGARLAAEELAGRLKDFRDA